MKNTKSKSFKSFDGAFLDVKDRGYMVSLRNSKEFLAILRRFSRIFSRILWVRSKTANRMQFINNFGNHLLKLNLTHGPVFVVKYLKSCTVALQRFIGGQPLKSLREVEPDLPLPRLTSSGLPAFIPLRDRRAIQSLSPLVLRWYLTLFSIYRIISIPGKVKLNTITDTYGGSDHSLNELSSWFLANAKKLVSNFVHNFEPKASLGLERIYKSSPSAKHSFAGFLNDVYSWKENINALAAFLNYGQFSLWMDFFEIYKAKIEPLSERHPLMKMDDGAVVNNANHLSQLLKVIPTEPVVQPLGQLAIKEEAAGKVRVFAMVDVWTQSALKPLHDWLFNLFRLIPNDSTFNQDVGFIRATTKAKQYGHSWCFDLSAATDRLPISLQVSILDSLFSEIENDGADLGVTYGEAWRNLLIDRKYYFPLDERSRSFFPEDKTFVQYSVGQPMGAFSSWGMLNLTHHLILQFLNKKLYKTKGWAENYEVLGDDIVIFDQRIADAYYELMNNSLDVKCNKSKSLLAPNRPVIEFAKRISINGVDISPFSWKQFISFDTLMGRASLASSVITRMGVDHPVRAFNAITGPTFDNTISTRKYSLINFAAMLVNRGLLPLRDLLLNITDPNNPFRFIGARIIGNIRESWFEGLLSWYRKDIPKLGLDPRVTNTEFFFVGLIKGYLTDKIADQYIIIKDIIKDLDSHVEPLVKGLVPTDTFIDLFLPGPRFRNLPKLRDLEPLSMEELLEIEAEYDSIIRDLNFFKIKPDRKESIENSLKLIKFIEKSRKKGELLVEYDLSSKFW